MKGPCSKHHQSRPRRRRGTRSRRCRRARSSRVRLEAEADPEILEGAAIVVHEGHGLVEVIAVERRQQAQFRENLESVADAHDQFPGIDELLQVVPHVVADAVREHQPRSHVVAV